MSMDDFRLGIIILATVWTVGFFWWLIMKDD
jgi:hypothetical protein